MEWNVLLIWMVFGATYVLTCSDDEQDSLVYNSGAFEWRMEVAARRRYLLYEVNHSEGFNLRRDVYMRMAALVKRLREYDDWILVLPPWGRLYHWRSIDAGKQAQIPWSMFFDLNSLKKYVPVMEFKDYVTENPEISMVYSLQHFKDTFDDGVKWEDKYAESECLADPVYHFEQHRVKGWFWGYDSVFAHNFSCLSLQGAASVLVPLLHAKDLKSILLDRAEIALHDSFGDAEYWNIRRSMRFAKHLIDAGNRFREKYLNSTDTADSTVLESDWQLTRPKVNSARGGPYISVHLRRQDFLYGRKEHVPSLKYAAEQIVDLTLRLNLTSVFVATDAPQDEFEQLVKTLPLAFRYVPTSEELQEFKDGGIAIIDQWICAHARHFIGSYESTFSFRIQEEREIFGFPPQTTFNRLCGDEEKQCDQPTRWPIVYEPHVNS